MHGLAADAKPRHACNARLTRAMGDAASGRPRPSVALQHLAPHDMLRARSQRTPVKRRIPGAAHSPMGPEQVKKEAIRRNVHG